MLCTSTHPRIHARVITQWTETIMRTELENDVRFLKMYAIAATFACAGLFLSAFSFQGDRRKRFEEIDVERINVVEKDGKLRLVISNRERQHPGVVDGKVMPRPNGRPPGLIFFNHRGDEAGGLILTRMAARDTLSRSPSINPDRTKP